MQQRISRLLGVVESLNIYSPPGDPAGYPCYSHNTMADLLDANNISWGYYPQGPSMGTSLWTAPNAIAGICLPLDSNNNCNGTEWNSHVKPHIPPYPPAAGQMAPILTDIQNCNLPQVSWVIPDGWWSDHSGGCPITGCSPNPQENGHVMGPAWVTDIVNAVGASTACDSGAGYWDNTVILITWDDWGGFYDHITPATPNLPGIGYSNQSGKQYVYGFRVPLLVVSAYAKYGYISGQCGVSGQSCPNLQVPYVHDFGSILNFVEWAFGTGGNPLYFQGYNPGTGISPQYLYADALAPDQPNAPGCSQQTCPYGLSDFFDFSQSHTFGQPIPLPYVLRNCTATWFESFGTSALCTSTTLGMGPAYPAPADPDDDAVTSAAPAIP